MKALLLLAALLAAPAFAADDEIPVVSDVEESDVAADRGADKPKTKVIYRKRTTINFDDAIVEGAATNPEGVYVVTPPEKQFGSLLKLRPNFHRELMRDSLLLK